MQHGRFELGLGATQGAGVPDFGYEEGPPRGRRSKVLVFVLDRRYEERDEPVAAGVPEQDGGERYDSSGAVGTEESRGGEGQERCGVEA